MKKFLVFLLLVGCSHSASKDALAPKDFETKYKSTQDAIILDVRLAFEFEKGAIPGAINLSYWFNFDEKLGNLEFKPIFVYCRSGGRGAKAANILREKGYEVYELAGGLNAWKKAGLPIQ